MIKHFVVTRLGFGIYSERLLAELIDLFEVITLASLTAQSSRDFVWLVAIDAHIPAAARGRIETLLRPYAHMYVIPIDVTELTHVRHGCFDWVWERCQDTLLEAGLIEDPGQYIVTSVLDADDAWHRDVVRTVNAVMAARVPTLCAGEENRGTWLRHTAGIAATFARGSKWFIAADVCEPMELPFMSMSVFVAARFSSGISACSSRHLGWPAYCKVLAFEMMEFPQDAPMWLYVRHARTTQPWDASALLPADAAASRVHCEAFGIDLDRVQRWRAIWATAPAAMHAGRSASEQYDRIFKIAALNRQIAALRRRAAAAEGLADKQAERARLIDMLYRSGAGEP